MMLLKACTRCGGDLQETQDMYGAYHACLQCGNVIDIPDAQLPSTAKTVVRTPAEKTEAAA